MSLRDYAVARDNFYLDPMGYNNPKFSFPCCVCRNKDKGDREEPCRTRDHNVNAELIDTMKAMIHVGCKPLARGACDLRLNAGTVKAWQPGETGAISNVEVTGR